MTRRFSYKWQVVTLIGLLRALLGFAEHAYTLAANALIADGILIATFLKPRLGL